MTRLDPVAATAEAKRTVVLLRDARAVLRRIDVLAATALAVDDPVLPAITELRSSAERLVAQLAHRGQAQQRQARQAVRRGR